MAEYGAVNMKQLQEVLDVVKAQTARIEALEGLVGTQQHQVGVAFLGGKATDGILHSCIYFAVQIHAVSMLEQKPRAVISSLSLFHSAPGSRACARVRDFWLCPYQFSLS